MLLFRVLHNQPPVIPLSQWAGCAHRGVLLTVALVASSNSGQWSPKSSMALLFGSCIFYIFQNHDL